MDSTLRSLNAKRVVQFFIIDDTLSLIASGRIRFWPTTYRSGFDRKKPENGGVGGGGPIKTLNKIIRN